jgi:hypothetical protein
LQIAQLNGNASSMRDNKRPRPVSPERSTGDATAGDWQTVLRAIPEGKAFDLLRNIGAVLRKPVLVANYLSDPHRTLISHRTSRWLAPVSDPLTVKNWVCLLDERERKGGFRHANGELTFTVTESAHIFFYDRDDADFENRFETEKDAYYIACLLGATGDEDELADCMRVVRTGRYTMHIWDGAQPNGCAPSPCQGCAAGAHDGGGAGLDTRRACAMGTAPCDPATVRPSIVKLQQDLRSALFYWRWVGKVGNDVIKTLLALNITSMHHFVNKKNKTRLPNGDDAHLCPQQRHTDPIVASSTASRSVRIFHSVLDGPTYIGTLGPPCIWVLIIYIVWVLLAHWSLLMPSDTAPHTFLALLVSIAGGYISYVSPRCLTLVVNRNQTVLCVKGRPRRNIIIIDGPIPSLHTTII